MNGTEYMYQKTQNPPLVCLMQSKSGVVRQPGLYRPHPDPLGCIPVRYARWLRRPLGKLCKGGVGLWSLASEKWSYQVEAVYL